MSQTISSDVDALRAGLTGEVFAPGDAGYDQARTVWNAGIDRSPRVIARCLSPDDVVAAVGFACERGMDVSVRGGAHNTSGTAVCDDGLMVDLSAMNRVAVNPETRRARVGGGALLRDLDAATQAHGLAVPAGVIGHTGVGGLTLGGGMGWLTRKFGLTIDSLVSAEVVTAEGQILRASAVEHPDLFWAIRGGGGNFGVVTEFEFSLHEVDPVVEFGLFFWGLEHGADVLRLARELVPAMSPNLNAIFGAINAPPAPFVPEQYRLQPGFVLLLAGFGSGTEHDEVVTRIRAELPPLFDMVTPMPYVALQQMLDEANAWGFHAYEKGTYIQDLSDAAIAVVTEHVPRKNSPMSLMLFYPLDGAYSRVDDADTAFGGGRSHRFEAFIIGLAPDPDLLAADRVWVREFWDALRPHAIGSGDGYVNGADELGEDRVRSTYGPTKYKRLAQIKRQYDPQNVFHLNGNIKPA